MVSNWLQGNKEQNELATYVLNQNFDIIETGIPPCLCCIEETTENTQLQPFIELFDEDFKEIILDTLVKSVQKMETTDCESMLISEKSSCWVLNRFTPRNCDNRMFIEVRIFDLSNRRYNDNNSAGKTNFSKSLVNIGTIFATSDDISKSILDSMKLILTDLNLNVLAIYRDASDEEQFILDTQVVSAGLENYFPTDMALPYHTVLGFKKVLKNQEIIVSDSINEPITTVLRDIILSLGIHSYVVAPIFIAGKFYGALVAGFCQERQWIPSEIDFLHASALILGQNIDREITKKQILTTRNDFINIFNNASDMVFIVNLDGTIIEANATATKTIGYERNELLGKHVEDISSVSTGIEPVMAGEMHQSRQLIFGTSLKRKTGEQIPIEVREKIVTYNNRKCILTIARDITDRKQFDRLILQTIIETEERERKRFAEALHDDLGPLLSALKIYVNLLVNKKFDPRLDDMAMEQMTQIIEQAIQTTKQTAANLMPNVLADFGLVEAVTDFIQKVNTAKVLDILFIDETKGTHIKGNSSKVFFSVTKELINNTIKHAKAQRAKLTLTYNDSNILLLKYEDDGIGFDFQKMLREENQGMGIKNLVSKIDTMKGTIKTETRISGGFMIIISLELPVNGK
jgi:PAS domain S-box-containing protein